MSRLLYLSVGFLSNMALNKYLTKPKEGDFCQYGFTQNTAIYRSRTFKNTSGELVKESKFDIFGVHWRDTDHLMYYNLRKVE